MNLREAQSILQAEVNKRTAVEFLIQAIEKAAQVEEAAAKAKAEVENRQLELEGLGDKIENMRKAVAIEADKTAHEIATLKKAVEVEAKDAAAALAVKREKLQADLNALEEKYVARAMELETNRLNAELAFKLDADRQTETLKALAAQIVVAEERLAKAIQLREDLKKA